MKKPLGWGAARVRPFRAKDRQKNWGRKMKEDVSSCSCPNVPASSSNSRCRLPARAAT